MNFSLSKYFSLLLLCSFFSAEAVPADTRQSCPAPLGTFCSINAKCVSAGTLIATGNAIFEGTVAITNTTQSTGCGNGALVVAGGLGVGGDLNVCGSATIDQNLTVFEQVSNRIGDTYTIGVDFPTIQAGIDLASSGLKPDSASNPPLPAGAKNVTLVIPAGTYHETLFIDTSFSTPEINDPSTDIGDLQGRGLRLIGDTRPIANMTYMNGGLVETDPSYLQNSGLNSLGTLNSVVTLTNVGNTITVVNTPGPNPDFGAAGVVPGDVIIIVDNNGTAQQRNVVSVSGNTVTYDGSPVVISGNGATLTFCANVHVINATPGAMVYIASGAVEMVGIWFSGDPAITTVYDVLVEATGKLFALNLLIDSRTSVNHLGLQSGNSGEIVGFVADADITGHISIIGGSLVADRNSNINSGNYYIMLTTALNTASAAFCEYGANMSSINSMQLNAAGSFNGYRGLAGSNGTFFIFNAFHCASGLRVDRGATCAVLTYLGIDSCTTGVNLPSGNFVFTGNVFAGLTPTISNCTTAISASVNGQFGTTSPLIFSSDTNGVQLASGAKFSSSSTNVTFSGVTNKYAIDATSTYNTPNNAGTDPSPSNIFTYSTAGTQAMNSAYLHQLLDSAGVVALQLDPSLAIAGTKIYRGKIYTLTAITAGPHTLTLLGGATFLDGTTTKTFTGIGSTITIQIDSDTKVAILSNIGVV